MSDRPAQHSPRGRSAIVLYLLLVVLIGIFLAMPKRDPLAPQLSRDTFTPGESFVNWFEFGHEDAGWYRSDFDNVDHFVQVGWAADHILFSGEGMALKLSDQPSDTNEHSSGEYQRRGRYGYGRYEVVMRPARGSGLVSSFFTHTGPYFGDPHDEIDFEFLGKDARQVYLNWFADGQEGTPRLHDLGFDATKDFHLYAFDWTPETIRWYVDGELIYERPEGSTPVPVTPSRIIANLWTGTPKQYSWHGIPDFPIPAVATYQCMSYRQLADTQTLRCSDQWQGGAPEVKGHPFRRRHSVINQN